MGITLISSFNESHSQETWYKRRHCSHPASDDLSFVFITPWYFRNFNRSLDGLRAEETEVLSRLDTCTVIKKVFCVLFHICVWGEIWTLVYRRCVTAWEWALRKVILHRNHLWALRYERVNNLEVRLIRGGS